MTLLHGVTKVNNAPFTRATESPATGLPATENTWQAIRAFTRSPACLPACLIACLSACLPAYLPACPPACLPTCLPACPPACLPACLQSPVDGITVACTLLSLEDSRNTWLCVSFQRCDSLNVESNHKHVNCHKN